MPRRHKIGAALRWLSAQGGAFSTRDFARGANLSARHARRILRYLHALGVLELLRPPVSTRIGVGAEPSMWRVIAPIPEQVTFRRRVLDAEPIAIVPGQQQRQDYYRMSPGRVAALVSEIQAETEWPLERVAREAHLRPATLRRLLREGGKGRGVGAIRALHQRITENIKLS